MSSVTVKNVKVDELSKFGFKADGKYVNYSKQITDADKLKVVPGAEFQAELYVADSGKEYLNKILSQAVLPAQTLAATVVLNQPKAPVDTERARKFTPKFTKKDDDTMSKADWAAKDVRISRQGIIQAAVQALAPVVDLKNLHTESEKLATFMLEFVNRK